MLRIFNYLCSSYEHFQLVNNIPIAVANSTCLFAEALATFALDPVFGIEHYN
jgi:hypothetical protein